MVRSVVGAGARPCKPERKGSVGLALSSTQAQAHAGLGAGVESMVAPGATLGPRQPQRSIRWAPAGLEGRGRARSQEGSPGPLESVLAPRIAWGLSSAPAACWGHLRPTVRLTFSRHATTPVGQVPSDFADRDVRIGSLSRAPSGQNVQDRKAAMFG